MAFVMSEAQPSFSEAKKKKTDLSHSSSQGDDHRASPPMIITSQLHLKSSKALNKDVVLRRIRQHKCLSRVRNAFQGLVNGSSSEEEEAGNYINMASSLHDQQKWLDQNDNFSSP